MRRIINDGTVDTNLDDLIEKHSLWKYQETPWEILAWDLEDLPVT